MGVGESDFGVDCTDSVLDEKGALSMLLESNWIVYGLLASIIASVHLWMGWFEARFVRSENRWIGFAVVSILIPRT